MPSLSHIPTTGEAKGLKAAGLNPQIPSLKVGGNKDSGAAKTAGQVKNHPSHPWDRGDSTESDQGVTCAIKAKYFMKKPTCGRFCQPIWGREEM